MAFICVSPRIVRTTSPLVFGCLLSPWRHKVSQFCHPSIFRYGAVNQALINNSASAQEFLANRKLIRPTDYLDELSAPRVSQYRTFRRRRRFLFCENSRPPAAARMISDSFEVEDKGKTKQRKASMRDSNPAT